MASRMSLWSWIASIVSASALPMVVVQDQLGNVHGSSADPRRSAGTPDTRPHAGARARLNCGPGAHRPVVTSRMVTPSRSVLAGHVLGDDPQSLSELPRRQCLLR